MKLGFYVGSARNGRAHYSIPTSRRMNTVIKSTLISVSTVFLLNYAVVIAPVTKHMNFIARVLVLSGRGLRTSARTSEDDLKMR